MILPRLTALAGAFALMASPLMAEDPAITYEAEVSASLSDGEHTPFWMAANREGLGSVRRNAGFVRGAVFRAAPGEKHFTWGFGADLVGAWRAESSFYIRQLYGELRYRDFQLMIGSKCMADTSRLVDRRLSSGDLLFSGNALPVPQVRLEMPQYLDIPGLNHWLGFKAYISYGRFTDGNWQKDFVASGNLYLNDVLFHSKGLLFRIGPQGKPFSFEGGLEMAAQFGGKVMKGDEVVMKLPHGLKDYLKILFPSGGGEDTPMGEQLNVLGNHVGEWSARLRWQPTGHDWNISLHYLHYFEDHSMMFFDYPWKDGLFGIEYHNPSGRWITGASYEFLSTTDQAGPVYHDHTPSIPEQVSGTDDYYNHFIYGAWQQWGMGLGNPLIISPVYNSPGSISFICNRIRGHHWAIEGQPLRELGYRVVASYTRGWGTYGRPFDDVKRNVNLLVELGYTPSRFPGWSATLTFGADRGGMLGRSNGVALSIKKTGLFSL